MNAAVRVGIADGVNGRNVRVTFPDRDDEVVDEIPLFKIANAPKVGESVVCVFSADGSAFCLGTYG